MNIQTITPQAGKPVDNPENNHLQPVAHQPVFDFSQLLITQMEPAAVIIESGQGIDHLSASGDNPSPTEAEIKGTVWQMFATNYTPQTETEAISAIDSSFTDETEMNGYRIVTNNSPRNTAGLTLPAIQSDTDDTFRPVSLHLHSVPEVAKQQTNIHPIQNPLSIMQAEVTSASSDNSSPLHHSFNNLSESEMLNLSVDYQSGQVKDGAFSTSARLSIEQGLQTRINWMIQNQVKSAEIRMDPPELGNLDIQVNVSKDHASVTITTANTQVRDVIESSVVRLKEMLESNGLQLGSFDIRQQNSNTNGNSFADQQQSQGVTQSDQGQGEPVQDTQGHVYKVGLLDTYA